MAVFVPMYRPLHVQLDPETPASTRRLKCSLEVLGLRFDRHGRKERRSGLRRLPGQLGLKYIKEQSSWRARSLEAMELKKMQDWFVKIPY